MPEESPKNGLIRLRIISPIEEITTLEVTQVLLPAAAGEILILPNRAPCFITLKAGKVEATYDRSSFVLIVESPEPLYGIQIYDVHGRQCLTLSHPGKSASVSLANLPKGFYIVAMRGIGFEQIIKIIK